MTMVGIVIIVVAVVAAALAAIYNRLVRLRVGVQNAWGQIEVQLKRRSDLIPNLVETVKGYASHERQTLEQVVEARQQAISAPGVREQAQAQNVLTQALGKLFALSESYPNLKANANFLQLQTDLATTENAISQGRAEYNNAVAQYNAGIGVFPAVLVAGTFGFTAREFFEVENARERDVPKVQF